MLAKKIEHMTLEEFNRMEHVEGYTYELIEGTVLMSPRPNIKHQQIQLLLSHKLASYFEGKQCNVITETELEYEGQVMIPDLFVYCDDINQYEQRYKGIPLVVIEILSKRTAFTDLNSKNQQYKKLGVDEYWIVSPVAKTVTVHNFRQQTTEEFAVDHMLTSDSLPELELLVGNLFG